MSDAQTDALYQENIREANKEILEAEEIFILKPIKTNLMQIYQACENLHKEANHSKGRGWQAYSERVKEHYKKEFEEKPRKIAISDLLYYLARVDSRLYSICALALKKQNPEYIEDENPDFMKKVTIKIQKLKNMIALNEGEMLNSKDLNPESLEAILIKIGLKELLLQ